MAFAASKSTRRCRYTKATIRLVDCTLTKVLTIYIHRKGVPYGEWWTELRYPSYFQTTLTFSKAKESSLYSRFPKKIYFISVAQFLKILKEQHQPSRQKPLKIAPAKQKENPFFGNISKAIGDKFEKFSCQNSSNCRTADRFLSLSFRLPADSGCSRITWRSLTCSCHPPFIFPPRHNISIFSMVFDYVRLPIENLWFMT